MPNSSSRRLRTQTSMLRLGAEITILMLEWAAVVGRLYNCHVENCLVAVKFEFEVPDVDGLLLFFLVHREATCLCR
jgi:hypothetical protein